MVSLSHYPQFETNLRSNRNVIELLLQLKSATAHGKHYIKVKPPLVRHLFRCCLLKGVDVNFIFIHCGATLDTTQVLAYLFINWLPGPH